MPANYASFPEEFINYWSMILSRLRISMKRADIFHRKSQFAKTWINVLVPDDDFPIQSEIST
ncbi:MAG: hypothetical protein ACFFCS_15055 [Candidatus Hodarchaeota archaeon]